MHESCPLNGLMHCFISVLAQIILPEAEQGRLTMAGRVPRAIRLSQHLDMEGQLEVLQLKAKLQEMTEMVQQLLQHLNLLEKMPGLFSKESPKVRHLTWLRSIFIGATPLPLHLSAKV